MGDRVALLEAAHRLDRRAQVHPRHQVGERVVVDQRRVLVGPGHAVDVELAVAVVEAQVLPQTRRLDEDLGAVGVHELLVAGGQRVAPHGVADVSVDVVLRGAGLVVGTRLLAVDRPPREQCAALAEDLGPFAGVVEHRVPEPQQVPGRAGQCVGQERQDVDLGVPEVVALVAAAGQALGGDAGALGPGGRLQQLEQRPAHRLLDDRVARHLDVAALPRLRVPVALLLVETLEALLHDLVERAAAAVGQLLRAGGVVRRRDRAGREVRGVLVDAELRAGAGVELHDQLPATCVGLAVGAVLERVTLRPGGRHLVVDGTRQRHP